MPGMAVFWISSIFGNSGSRSAMFLRIDASSAKAAEAKQAARRDGGGGAQECSS